MTQEAKGMKVRGDILGEGKKTVPERYVDE